MLIYITEMFLPLEVELHLNCMDRMLRVAKMLSVSTSVGLVEALRLEDRMVHMVQHLMLTAFRSPHARALPCQKWTDNLSIRIRAG